ncbi:MAG: DUF4397 domain-containing protein [Thermoprotei archaeon]|jgi:hypothetical protein
MVKLRFIHASSDATSLDIYLNDNKIIERMKYKSITDYIDVPNECILNFRISGAPKNSPPIFYIKFKFEPEISSFTAFLIGLAGSKEKKDSINVIVLQDQVVSPNSAVIRLINASPAIDSALFKFKDGSLIQNLEYGKAFQITTRAGKKILQVIKDNNTITETTLDILDGKIYEVILVGLTERKPPLELCVLSHN